MNTNKQNISPSDQLKQQFENEVNSFKGWFDNFSNLTCQNRWKLWQYYAEWLQEREINRLN